MRKSRGILALGLAVAAVFVSVQPASAASTTFTVPLELAYFDENVAAENGFKIVTRADGSQESVPVTEAARALVSRESRHTIIGPCGSSSLTLSRVGGTSKVFFTTAFQVKTATKFHQWTVDLTRNGQRWSYNLSGGPTFGSWNTSRTTTTGNNQGVLGVVRAGSYAMLVTGAVCYSGGPSSSS